jgi:hypothetical protein
MIMRGDTTARRRKAASTLGVTAGAVRRDPAG